MNYIFDIKYALWAIYTLSYEGKSYLLQKNKNKKRIFFIRYFQFIAFIENKFMISEICHGSNLGKATPMCPSVRVLLSQEKRRVRNLSFLPFIRKTLPNCRQKVGAKSNLQNGRHHSTSSGTPFHQKACPLLESGKKGGKVHLSEQWPFHYNHSLLPTHPLTSNVHCSP